MKFLYITEEQRKRLAAQDQVGGKVNSALMCYEDIENDEYQIGTEGDSSFNGNSHVIDENSIPNLQFGININIDETDWLELIFSGKKTVETRSLNQYSQWLKHKGEYVGLVRTTKKISKSTPTGVLVGYAKILDVFPYDTADSNSVRFNDDVNRHQVAPTSSFASNRCGLLLGDVHRLPEKRLKGMGQQAVRPIVYLDEAFDLNPEKIRKAQERYNRYLAIENYGVTDNFMHAGFILADGQLLDLSNVSDSARSSHSSIDVIGASLRDFISYGEIRLQPESPGLEICVKPTEEQYFTIQRFVNFFKDKPAIYIDCVDKEGKNIWNIAYKNNKYSIISDLQNYFDKGVVPTPIEDDPNFVDFAYFRDLDESIQEDVSPEDIDLSSFKIQKKLNPKFWKDGHLDSRIRMRLLDIADDFIEFLGIDWAEPKDIIMTGSLANFNWSKEYSDIDLHIVMDYSEIDKRTDFVDNYFYSQKQLWNSEHEGLSIMGYPIEVFVQDEDAEHDSSGVYSLERDTWLIEPDRDVLTSSKISKSYIKEKTSYYMNQIDKLCYLYKKAKDDEYKLGKVQHRAIKLFDKIKADRKLGFEKSNGKEINNLNIVFKALRRNGYIEKLVDLKSKTYNKLNSLE